MKFISSNNKKIEAFIAILFFVYIFISFLQPLADPDTPWHLKTGEYIYLNKSIPSSDPFSFAKDKIPFYGHFILTQYWLSQLLYYVIYKSFGPAGLVITGASVFTLLILILWSLINRKGFYLSLFVTGGFAANVLQNYSGIRPQIFTFLFAAIILFLMEKYREKGFMRYLVPLPLIMLLWANIHGGFIYGIVIIAIYVLFDGLNLFIGKKLSCTGTLHVSKEKFYGLLSFCVISVLISMINPNTYKAFLYVFVTHSQGLFAKIDEYQSPVKIYTAKIHKELIYSFWIYIIVVSVLIVLFIKSRLVFPVVLLLFAIMPTLFSIRYIPLFAVVAVSAFRYLPEIKTFKISEKTNRLIALFVIAMLAFFILYNNPFKDKELFQMKEGYCYAVRAAKFLAENRISGNIFSSYNKSSYLLFRLFPDSRLYSDSRYMSEERIKKSEIIMGGSDSLNERAEAINALLPEDIGSIHIDLSNNDKYDLISNEQRKFSGKKWKDLLNDAGVEIIASEAMNFYSGEIYPFIFKLALDKEWRLIYYDGNIMIFIKDIPKFKDVIARYEKPKALIYDQILMEGAEGLGKDIPDYYSSVALALLLKGITDKKADNLIKKALSIAPGNFQANYAQALYTLMTKRKH